MVLLLSCLAWINLSVTAIAQNTCEKPGTLIRETALYDHPPQFRTGGGWQYGKKLATVKAGEKIWICEEKAIGFAFSTQHWLQIGYRKGNSWFYGWVYGADVKFNTAFGAPHDREPAFSFFASVYAQEPPVESAPAPRPPLQPIPDSPPAPLVLWPTALDLFTFLAMVVGMAAKSVVDLLDSWSTAELRAEIRKAIIPLFVSPIVYLSLIKSADFNITSNREFLTLMFLAFQNGFFWQTVFASMKHQPANAGK
jgi:hypothetical protein